MAVRHLSPIVETNTPSFYPAQRIEKKRRICQKPACVRVSSSGMILRFRIVFALTQDLELHPSPFNLHPTVYTHARRFFGFSPIFSALHGSRGERRAFTGRSDAKKASVWFGA